MTVLFAENFRGYESARDPAFRSFWSDGRDIDGDVRVKDNLGELEFDNTYLIREGFPSAVIPSDTPPGVLRVAFNARGHMKDYSMFMCGSGDRGRAIQSGLAPVRIDGSNAGLVYRYTVWGPSGNDNDRATISLETGFEPAFNTDYHYEIEIDHRLPTASIKILANGATILDETYDRDDVDGVTEEPVTSFGWIGFGPRNGTFSNIVAWDDQSPGLSGFPAGPLAVETLNTPEFDLQAGPVNTGTEIQYDTTSYTTYQVEDPADQSATVYATFAEIRSSSSGGTEPARIGVKADVGAASQEWETLTYPGHDGVYDRVKITDDATMADVNAATISLRKAP